MHKSRARQNHLYQQYLAAKPSLDKVGFELNPDMTGFIIESAHHLFDMVKPTQVLEDCNAVMLFFGEKVKATTDPDKKAMQVKRSMNFALFFARLTLVFFQE